MTPVAVFDDIEYLQAFAGRNMVKAYPPRGSYPEILKDQATEDYRAALDFLLAFGSSKETFKSYRREVDRFLIWLWNIKKVSLKEITRHDIENYFDFCKNPPMEWRDTEIKRRFIVENGERKPNPEWRPFVVQTPKVLRKMGKEPSLDDWSQSMASFSAMLRILRSFCQFLVDEDYLPKNPVAQLKSKFRDSTKKQRQHVVRRLTNAQVKALFEALGRSARHMPDEDYERMLFMLSCVVAMYLRISEVAASDERQPTHGHFFQSVHEVNGVVTKSWWFTVLGKGNKQREIPVSDELLKALRRYRTSCGLPPLPVGHERDPLFPKLKGKGGLTSSRHVRKMMQRVFDSAYQLLVERGQEDESRALQTCTVHWLRHTGISIDVMNRPMPHVRDSAGHSSLSVTGLYIDNDPLEAYLTAKDTKLLPDIADKARAGHG